MAPLQFLFTITFLSVWALGQATDPDALNRRATKPNIVFILTDDQDKQMDSPQYMQTVQTELVEKGTFFDRHYCTVALCCPSRVNLLTGRMAHNTKVTDLKLPFGGYDKFISQNLNDKWIAPLMQKAGYKTYYTGKLMNDHSQKNWNKPRPGGLDGNNFLIGPGTYNYLQPWFQKNNEPPHMENGYATDLLAQKSYEFIDEGAKSGRPFFITIATVAPHANLAGGGKEGAAEDIAEDVAYDDNGLSIFSKGEGNAPIPAERHKNLFPDVKVPRTDNFNPDRPSGASWVRDMPKQSAENVQYNDLYYRRRLQALQAVDDLVKGTIDRLKQNGVLDNTYIIYSTDNGYHIGQHRLQPGKHCPYEEDINIPLVIRGPNVPKNQRSEFTTSHTDLVPTILGWAGADLPKDLDGKAIPINGDMQGSEHWEHTQVEHWGDGGFDGKFGKVRHPNTTYKAVRVIGNAYNLYYSVWCNNEHELYDMKADRGQMTNLYTKSVNDAKPTFPYGLGGKPVTLTQLQARLDALLLVMKDCKGPTCVKPWAALHPKGDVKTLTDALGAAFDDFYQAKQNKVGFEECTKTYQPKFEGPTQFKVFGNRAGL